MKNDQKWEDLEPFRMNRSEINEVVREAHGCTVCFTRADGHPIGVWVSHAVLDGEIYVTTTNNRPKTRRWRQDPRTSAIFEVAGKGAVTVVGRVELSEDPELRHRFLAALADKDSLEGERREAWFRHMDTDGRVIGRIVPEKFITFDQRKLVW